LTFYQRLMQRMREAILTEKWNSTYRELQLSLKPSKSTRRALPNTKQGPFELVTNGKGVRAVRHTGHNELLPSFEQASRFCVDETRLSERLLERDDEPLRILDFRLGSATNALAALTAAVALGGARRRPLEIVSLDVDAAALELALSDPKGFPFLEQWKHACDALLRDESWEERSLSWRFIRGEPAHTIDEVDGLYDVIFYEPRSPLADASLWEQTFMHMVRARARSESAVLTTSNRSLSTRASFLLAGFFVGHGPGTVAAARKELLKAPLDARWLEEWARAAERAPHGVPLSDEVERVLRAHLQFR
jgi:hypothetical protein